MICSVDPKFGDKISGALFQKVMRGTYVNGFGYSGWTEENAKEYLVEFSQSIPKVSNASLKRNKKSYTLVWSQGKEEYKALFSIEEDAFGGPLYRDGDIVLQNAKVETKPKGKATKAAKGKEKKEISKAKKSSSNTWKTVDNTQEYIDSHITPLFYYLCIQNPPTGEILI